MALEVKDRLLIRLKAGENVWRHCVIAGAAEELSHRVLTPSRVVRLIDFSDANINHIIPWDEETLPGRLKKAACFLDVDGPGGKFTPEEIERAIKLAASRGEGLTSAGQARQGPAYPRCWRQGGQRE